MMDSDMVSEIKTRLGVTGSYQDALILALANDVKAFMVSGGISQLTIDDSSKSIGAIARGVADLWNFGSGDGKFSEVFMQRITQLSLLDDSVEEGGIEPISDEEIDDCTDCLDEEG